MGSKKSIISSMKKTQIPWVMIALVALLVVCVMPKLMMGCNGGWGVVDTSSNRVGSSWKPRWLGEYWECDPAIPINFGCLWQPNHLMHLGNKNHECQCAP